MNQDGLINCLKHVYGLQRSLILYAPSLAKRKQNKLKNSYDNIRYFVIISLSNDVSFL